MVLTRAEAMRVLQEGQERLANALNELSEDQLIIPRTIGGGEWSAKDLIAHVRAWEAFALEALEQWREGERPSVEDTFTRSERIDELNAMVFEENRLRPPGEVKSEAERTHRTLLQEIEGMSDEQWLAKAPYPTDRRRRLGELLGSIMGAPQRPFGHAFAHVPDLEAYVATVKPAS